MKLVALSVLTAAAFCLSAPAMAQAPSCPAASFPEFLARFQDDEAVQRAFTAAPLAETHLAQNDAGDPEPVTRRTPAVQIKFPVMPSQAKATADGLKVSIGGDAARPEVTIGKADTDWKTTYRFERRTCWTLVALDDASL